MNKMVEGDLAAEGVEEKTTLFEHRRPYRRRVSAIERYNLVLNEVYRYNVVPVIEGKGSIDPEKLRHAIKVVGQANPGIQVRLKGKLGFMKWVDSGISPSVLVTDGINWDGKSEQGADFLNKKFTPLEGGEVFDVLLMPGNPARIAFRGVHAAVDARGMIHIMMETFRVLRGEPPLGSVSTLTDTDIRKKYQEKVAISQPEKKLSIPPLKVKEPTDNELKYIIRRLQIDGSKKFLLSRMAHFLASQARKHFGEGNVQFTMTVDYRNLRENVVSTGNLTGYVRIDIDENDSPRAILKKLSHEIKSYADCYSPKVLKLVPWLPINFMINQCKKNLGQLLYHSSQEVPTGGIVSIGKLDLKALSCDSFRAEHVVGIPGSVGKMNVVMVEGDQTHNILFSAPEAYNAQGQLDELVLACERYMH